LPPLTENRGIIFLTLVYTHVAVHKFSTMKASSKKWMGIVSFLPLIAIVLWAIYLLVVNNRLVEEKQMHQHEKVVTLIFNNYGGSFVLFMLAFLIGLAVLVAFIIHLKKVRTMNGSSKLAWLVFMAAFGPLAFPVYYFIEVRHEPEDVPMYAGMEEGMG